MRTDCSGEEVVPGSGEEVSCDGEGRTDCSGEERTEDTAGEEKKKLMKNQGFLNYAEGEFFER